MPDQLLIVTPEKGLGESICRTLEDGGDYRAALAASPQEALALARQVRFSLAVLDVNLSESDRAELGQALQEASPGLRLMVTPGAKGDHVLAASFPLADLLKQIERLMRPTALPWLQDVNRAAQHLTRLSLEVSALAALITRSGSLWAYAGQLPQAAAEELSRVALSGPPRHGAAESSDLARFIRLEATGGEYMLYTTPLDDDMILALTFEAEMPFSQIRAQAGQLARALAAPPKAPGANQPTLPPAPQSVPPQPASSSPAPGGPPSRHPDKPPSGAPSPREIRAALQKLFASLDTSRDAARNRAAVPAEPDPIESGMDEHWPDLDMIEKIFTPSDGAVESAPILAEPLEDDVLFQPVPLPDSAEGQITGLPGGPAACYSLHYACLLVPRLPHHHLAGALKPELAAWMRELCRAFEWRLEHLSIRPDYLLWICSAEPETSPGYLIRLIRRHTSQRIFSEFPHLALKNPSGDFWAPGYLVIATAQPPPAAVVRDFLAAIRSGQ